MRIARRWREVLLSAACGLAVAACSSEPESTSPTLELSTTTVTTLPPTTVTTVAPTTTEDPRIAEVEAAVAAFHDAQLRILLDSAQPIDTIEDYAAGDVLESISTNTLKSRAEGSYFEGRVSLEPLDTSIDTATTATHRSCTGDLVTQFDRSGAVIVPADEAPFLWTYELHLESSEWLVAAIRIGVSCEN